MTSLLYACESWTVYQRHARKLNHFHTTCLRKLLGIKWQEKVPDTEVLDRAGLPSIHTMLMQSQLRWAGHVVRMPDNRLPKILFYGELQEGKRNRGCPKKRYKDCLKASLKAFMIDPATWELTASDRSNWRTTIHRGAMAHEAARTQSQKQRREARKKRNDRLSPSKAAIPCPHCPR